jgi:hypothetical protein
MKSHTAGKVAGVYSNPPTPRRTRATEAITIGTPKTIAGIDGDSLLSGA